MGGIVWFFCFYKRVMPHCNLLRRKGENDINISDTKQN